MTQSEHPSQRPSAAVEPPPASPARRRPRVLPPYGLASDVLPGAEAPPAPARQPTILGFADELQTRSAQPAPARSEATTQLVTFCLGPEEYGVSIARVREITRVEAITRVPDAPKHIRGVTNLRGRLLPIVETRTRLGLAPAEVTAETRIVVVEVGDRIVGLLVDAVRQVIRVPSSAIESPPDEVRSAGAEHVAGVVRFDARLVIVLDVDATLAPRARGEAS